jgi:1,4-alpha-glucan branching enzyme
MPEQHFILSGRGKQMGLIAPKDKGYIGGITKLRFDQHVSNLSIKVNGVYFHAEEGDTGPSETFSVDLNGIAPDTSLTLDVSYRKTDGTTGADSIIVWKPRHDLGGMGATVIREGNDINGVFFKFWLPKVKDVFIHGCFNGWKDKNRLDQLGDTGYWFGFSCDARPGDDYRFFVYGLDGKNDEVSDPAARKTIKTRFNEPNDAQDANAVIVDPAAFLWRHDRYFAAERHDFRRMVIYQAHWGTFLRTGSGDLPYETFVTQSPGASLDDKRASVRNKLQYVQDLGFTAIELLPIHEANGDKNAGYDPSFFFAVESTYGSPDDLRMLVDEAHGIGLSVILDSVINHLTADPTRSSFSQEFIRGWYIRENAPWSNHRQWEGSDWGPDPDYDRYEIRNLLTDCMLMYVDEFHVDGIRFDATTTIPRDALKDMIGCLRGNSRTCGTYLIAEHITDDPLPYIVGDIGFHGGWYKPAFFTAMDGILQRLGRGDLDSVRKVFETDYQGEPSTAIKYITGSHDENWVSHKGRATASRLGGSGNLYVRMKMRLGWSLAACSLGTPMMFMGTECLEDAGWDNSSGYGAMNWYPETGSNGANFKQMIRDINRLRHDHAALRGGNIDAKLVHWDNDNGVVAYKRWDQSGGVFLIVINVSDRNWGAREYQVQSETPNSVWHECFNSQYVNYGGWTGACNSDPAFYPRAGVSGLLQGMNLAKWCLLILRKEG